MLTAKKIAVMECLIKGNMTKPEIAKQCGVCEKTITNWQKDAEFVQAYNEAINVVLNEASGKALNTILGLMENADSETVRMNCAKDILSRAGFDATNKQKVDLATESEIVINII